MGNVNTELVQVENPEGLNLILGQSHFIKTVEDLYETLVQSSPSIRFGLAFNEASGLRLVRHAGNDEELVDLATRNIRAIAAGHAFIVFLKEGFPINVLNAIKMVPEVCRIYAATANPLQVIVASSEQGRGILGVIDGERPLGVEGPDEVAERQQLLRRFGYKV